MTFLTTQIFNKALHILCTECQGNHLFKDMVHESLNHIAENIDSFSNISSLPFVEHFVNRVNKLPENHDESIYFDLFEDIVIFFREKTLFSKQEMAEIERKVLQTFEQSDEWRQGDGKLVSEWYWSILPNLNKN